MRTCLESNYSPFLNNPNMIRYGFSEGWMPAAYSYDLRKKAMEALDEGQSREEVAERFKIGKTTLFEWQQRRKETGDFKSKKPGNAA